MDLKSLLERRVTHAEARFILYAFDLQEKCYAEEPVCEDIVFETLSKTMLDRPEIIQAILRHTQSPMHVIQELLEHDFSLQRTGISIYELFRIAERDDISPEVAELLARRKEMELDYRILCNARIPSAVVDSIAKRNLGTKNIGVQRAALKHPNVSNDMAERLVEYCQDFLAESEGLRWRKKHRAVIVQKLQERMRRNEDASTRLLLLLIRDKEVPTSFVEACVKYHDETVHKAACERLGIKPTLSLSYRFWKFLSDTWYRLA
jgi:hypothetical protein